ncbi:MAG: hypothetical protein V7704_10810 [Aurantimonas endophytica]|uniref:Uncharacterized protein n=1 Tax=Aurantimonas endophytica TaxID=1522175 RepID=A0A7W6HI72_9HYPH|nr:hypothetical protein [Aurantimonas endophytica]MCO6405942.1 hypothetical protein [Aurantimonas endophytica]
MLRFDTDEQKVHAMDNSRRARERAEAVLSGPPDRPVKGSAVGIIAAETQARGEKTARLKQLRLERDAAEPPAPAKVKKPAAKAKTKTATKAKAAPKAAKPAARAKKPAA